MFGSHLPEEETGDPLREGILPEVRRWVGVELGESLELEPLFTPRGTPLGHGQQSIQPEDDRGFAAEFGGGYI